MGDFDEIIPAHQFREDSAPTKPGLYAWLRDGAPVFWGAARMLRKRLWTMEARVRVDSQSKSALRERVALRLLRDEGAQFRWRKDPERRKQVDQWLAGCAVGWRLMPSEVAEKKVSELLDVEADSLPLLHRWRPVRARTNYSRAIWLASAALYSWRCPSVGRPTRGIDRSTQSE